MDERILGLECSIFYGLFGYSPELYAELMPNLRPHVPYNTVRGKEQEIEARVGRGKMNAHGPHKDSWRFHPSNTINVWLALSDVTPLNGMMLVPHSTDYLPKFADNEIVPGCDTYPERQYLTQMSTGDALLFRAELMHGSILNQTENTRFAFSMRCTVEEPDFHRDFMSNAPRKMNEIR
jgi:ectoine hydroxylase-related dioxygenase (phytanoyl-CoA dioxygenase family)